jgi:hypothetical protein
MTLTEAFSSIDKARQFYNQWVDEVRRQVPQDRLLEVNVTLGHTLENCKWQPFCAFLNVPVPVNRPFPRSNESKNISKRLMKKKIWCWFQMLVLVTIAPLAAASAIKSFFKVFNY